jgi:hypothetical protein
LKQNGNSDEFPSYAYVYVKEKKRQRRQMDYSSNSKQQQQHTEQQQRQQQRQQAAVMDFLRPHAVSAAAPLQNLVPGKQAPQQAPNFQYKYQSAGFITQTASASTCVSQQAQLHALQAQLARAEATRARVLSGMLDARSSRPVAFCYLP